MKTHDLELCEGQQGRLVFTITAPPGTDTTLRGAVFADPKELLPLPMVAEGENALVIPATQAGYHHYEVRAGGATILYGVLRTLPSPLVPPGAAGWDIDVDMTQELPHVDVGLLQGPQGPQGEPGASAYEAAVAAGYEGTEEEFNAAMAALPQDAAAAAQSAADAAASQEAAAGSAQAAAASAEAASGSAAAAADSASTASAQAGVATAQAGAAAESAETATTQATAAGQSATAAAGSATDAGNSATAAAGSASDAAASASDAATDAATATAQATEATTQAGNAAASATTASEQATAAGNSASAAAGSATTASTKATEAAGSATTASTKATEAANSASAAAQSAADAAESAELLGDAALQGSNNAFTQTNTFNGAVALNGPVTLPDTTQLAMGPDNYTILQLLQLMDNMRLVQLSGSFTAINFGKVFPGWYSMTRDLDINLPACTSVVSTLYLNPSAKYYFGPGVYSLRLAMDSFVTGFPLGMNSNGNFKNLSLSFSKATSINFGANYTTCSDRLYFYAPLITSLPNMCNAQGWSYKCPLSVDGNIDKVTELHTYWDTYWTRTTHWGMSAKALSNFKIHGIKLDLESVQFIAGNLKDWSGDTATHEANIGVDATIQDSAAGELAAAKEQLEAKGWTVTYTYN